MKLIVIQHNLNERGGAERVILEIAKHYDAPVYTLGYDRNGTFEGFKGLDVRVIAEKGRISRALPGRVSNAVHYGWNFYNLKIKEDYDIINPHMSPSEWSRRNNPRCLWYCHTPPREIYDPSLAGTRKKTVREKMLYGVLSKVYARTEMEVVKSIEEIATNSGTTNARIKRVFNRSSEVINPGTDYRNFRNSGDYKYFLYHSRFAEQKRQEYAIEAFSRLQRLGAYRDYKLVLSGSLSGRYSDFGKYYDKLKAMRARNVVFRPNPKPNELIGLYANATAVLFTAINEDYGIVPLEGMASSKPVISVNEGGPTETIVNGKTGFLVNNPEEMAKKMRFVIEHGKIAEGMGREGRRRVEARYSWKAFFKRFDALARRVAKS